MFIFIIWRCDVKNKLKRFLHKFFKIFIIFMLATLALNLVIFIALYINHKGKLQNESGYLVPPGQMVDVNGHDIHVMCGGEEESDKVLVFLHSENVYDDSIALQPMLSELKGCRYVYIDRSGYGFSDNSGSSKEIGDILKETRTVLETLGIEGPYTLVSMGTSGILAFYWANTYPEEVESIIGVNMNYPEQFEGIPEEQYCGIFEYILVLACKVGAHRMVDSGPVNPYGIYSQKQMSVRNALYGKGAYTSDMYNEALNTIDNADKVTKMGFPEETPIYLICANPLMEPYVNDEADIKARYEEAMEENSEVDYVAEYNKSIKDYMAEYKNVIIDEMSGPERIYLYDYKGLADKINIYIQ